jgi:hypothetical protein
MKWTIVAVVVAIPGIAWAGTRMMADDGCGIPGCPCAH